MGIHKLNGVQEGQLKDKNFKFRLEIVPRPGVLQPPMFSPFRPFTHSSSEEDIVISIL